MRVYKDIFNGDELISDSYAQETPFGDQDLVDVAFEVRGKRVAKGAEDYGICDNDEDTLAAGGVSAAANVEMVVDIIDGFRYSETSYSKKDFGAYIKGYMQRVKKHLEQNNPSRVDKFIDGAQKLVKQIVARFDDCAFFLGEQLDSEAAVVCAYYVDGEDAPRFIYIRDGLKEEKY